MVNFCPILTICIWVTTYTEKYLVKGMQNLVFITHKIWRKADFHLQLKKEIASLLDLKKQLGNDSSQQKFVLKTPKVVMLLDSLHIVHHLLH